MATFVQRKGPGGKRVWQALVRRRGYPQQTQTFDTKGAAEVWAGGIENAMGRGTFVSSAEAEGTTLAEALDRYLREITPTKKPSTQSREAIRARVIAGIPLARRSLASIKGSDIATFIRGRQAEGLGANAIRLDLALLSHVFMVAGSAWAWSPWETPSSGSGATVPSSRAAGQSDWSMMSIGASSRPLQKTKMRASHAPCGHGPSSGPAWPPASKA